VTRRRTRLLVVLLAASACAAVAAHARLRAARAGAVHARESLGIATRQLDELHRWRTGAEATKAVEPDTSQLTRVLREAATRAGATDKLASIEPGPPARTAGGDYAQTPVFLRLERLSLKQLTLSLHHLAQLDPASRAQGIELSASGTEGQTELWNADVTISYLTFAPGDAR
jgi:hypothetical protein